MTHLQRLQVAALEASLGKDWTQYSSDPVPSQRSSGPPVGLQDLMVMHESGTLYGVPAKTLRAVLVRFQHLVYKQFESENRDRTSPLPGKASARLWMRVVSNVARRLPGSDSQKLRSAMASVSTPLCLPNDKYGPNSDGLLNQWRFVTKLSAVEGFWNLHRRCPRVAPRARDPEEASIAETLVYWRAKDKEGTLDKVPIHSSHPATSCTLSRVFARA